MGRVQHYRIRPLGPCLYDGIAGVLLFLGGLERVTGAGMRDLVTAASLTLKIQFREALAQSGTSHPLNINGASGLVSTLYVLTRLGEWLKDDSFHRDAFEAAHLLRPALLADNPAPDILEGLSGTILSLLGLYEHFSDGMVLELAIECGLAVLSSGKIAEKVVLKPGFLEGMTGIAYALARLYFVTGESRFQIGARKIIAQELDLLRRHWKGISDHERTRGLERSEDRLKIPMGWCRGISGIGLALLRIQPLMDPLSQCDDLERIIADASHVLSTRSLMVDHLCCGYMGLVELALTAGLSLNRSDLLALARSAASCVVTHAVRHGYHRCFHGTSSPGFYMGISGIGYQLLRTAAPQNLPSVLLWE